VTLSATLAAHGVGGPAEVAITYTGLFLLLSG